MKKSITSFTSTYNLLYKYIVNKFLYIIFLYIFAYTKYVNTEFT